jgi:uncharacterized protein DUF2017
MGLRRKGPIERVRGGGYRLNLATEERAVLAGMVAQLRDLLLASPAETPQLRRLFPTAYPTDPEADAEYQRLMREELVGSRLAAMQTVSTVLDPEAPGAPVVSAEELAALLTSMNSLRLVLGTICDVGEQDELDEITPEHPMFAELQAYGYLSYLVDAAVDALSADL